MTFYYVAQVIENFHLYAEKAKLCGPETYYHKCNKKADSTKIICFYD